jgi:hypothetical protein
MMFDVWLHTASGATALTPTGYQLLREGNHCIARSQTGPFLQLIWGSVGQASSFDAISHAFEDTILLPMVRTQFGGMLEGTLSRVPRDGAGRPIPGVGPVSENRSDGLVFSRRGLVHFKSPFRGPGAPLSVTFDTRAARNGSFMGVASISEDVPANTVQCEASGWTLQGCELTHRYFREWTHFLVSTQLSTYPVN